MHAVVRPLPSSYARATRVHFEPTGAIDLALARAQHRAYVEAIEASGVEVVWAPAAHAHPDSVFVEDAAVVWGRRVVRLRSAHPGRQGEGEALDGVWRALGLEVVELASGTVDGGDVLAVGQRLLVGRSERTDEAGMRALGEALQVEVVPVPVPSGSLHLKCLASVAAPGVVVVVEGLSLPGVSEVVRVPATEAYAANVLGLPGRVLVPAGYPQTAARLRAEGLAVLPLEVSEFRKGDGSLTCLSVLVG